MTFTNSKEKHFPMNYRPIIKRLQQALANKEVREIMELEDELMFK